MHRLTQVALGAFVALAAAGTPCLADETPTAEPVASTSTVVNVKVTRDKETGQLRAMTAQEEAALKAATKAQPKGVLESSRPVTTTVKHADGRMTGRLSMATMESLVVVQTADGKAVLTHDANATSATSAGKAELARE